MFQTYQSLEPPTPAPLLREIEIYAHWVFYSKVNSEQLLFEASFDIIDIFGSIEP